LLTLSLCAGATEKIVYYAPYQGSTLLTLLADDSGPRALLVPSIYQNFQAIAALGANDVVVRCDDETSYVGEEGGGWPYNIAYEQKPQYMVAEEIIVSLAHAAGLRVTFAINPSFYHLFVSQAEPSINAPDMKNYIKSVINPGAFFNPAFYSTTQLNLVGLTNHTAQGNWALDSRVYGFIFPMEVQLQTFYPQWLAQQTTFYQTYWPYFSQLVHVAGGSAKTMIYFPSSPANYPNTPNMGSMVRNSGSPYDIIHTWKNFFSQYLSTYKPDLMGFEWYAAGDLWGRYGQSATVPNIETITFAGVDAQYPYDYSVPPSRTWMAEGGANPQNGIGLLQNYDAKAPIAANSDGVPAISIWASNSGWEVYMSTYPYTIPGPGGDSFSDPATDFNISQAAYELFAVSIGTQDTRHYPSPAEGWWLPQYAGYQTAACIASYTGVGAPYQTSWISPVCYTNESANYGATATALTFGATNWAGAGILHAFMSF
jgi:hypothetical protein